ncbi:lysozyme [Chitiniphilus eburneus]|uniref:lysozyme n=1 Tax=Chitiniphilus eburneus TaxID=2571148 RepID=UPI0035D0E6AF
MAINSGRLGLLLLSGVAIAAVLLARRQQAGETQDSAGWFLPDVFGFMKTTIAGAIGYDMQESWMIREKIKKDEQLRLTVYETKKGNGDWTIGYGHKVKQGERYFPVGDVKTITAVEANLLFEQDIKREGTDKINRWLTVTLSQLQFDALVSMAYNAPSLCYQRVIPLVNQGRHEEAARAIETAQSSSAPWSAYPGLKLRRQEEAAMYRQGTPD